MKNGYTLIEIIVAIVIVAILATLAVPKFTAHQDAAMAGEAISALSALHSAQLRYCLEHDCTGNKFPSDCELLDVDIPALNNFDTLTCANTGTISLDSTGGTAFTLIVDGNGKFTCPACPQTIKNVCPNKCI